MALRQSQSVIQIQTYLI